MNLKDIRELYDLLVTQIVDKKIYDKADNIIKNKDFGEYVKIYKRDNCFISRFEYDNIFIYSEDNLGSFKVISIEYKKIRVYKHIFQLKNNTKQYNEIAEYISGEWEDIIDNIYNTGKLPEIKNEQNNNGIYNRVVNWFKNKKETENE